MLVKPVEVEELANRIRKMALTKQLNFLIGSGASTPAIPLMNNINADTDEERNIKLERIVRDVSKEVLSSENQRTDNVRNNLEAYRNLLSNIIEILNLSNSRQTPRTANIFTTNYDLFIEKASDEVLQNYRFVFNDGASGYFDRKLDGANYNRTVSYKGLNDNYNNEIPSLTLIKPHGSVNWEKQGDSILVRNIVLDESEVVKPTGEESKETFINNHFHEMLRIFQLELDKPQSVLFVIGFSFQDSHIAKMIKRALQNPELMIYAFGYNNDDRNKLLKNLDLNGDMNNFVIITPEILGWESNSTLTLNEFNDILKVKE